MIFFKYADGYLIEGLYVELQGVHFPAIINDVTFVGGFNNQEFLHQWGLVLVV